MINKLKGHTEPNKTVRILETIALILLLAGFFIAFAGGMRKSGASPGQLTSLEPVQMVRDESQEEYDEDSKFCEIVYVSGEDTLSVDIPCEEYEEYSENTITAYGIETEDGTRIFFDHPDTTTAEVADSYREILVDRTMPTFNFAISLLILAISVGVMLFFGKVFTTYEKCWFLTIMALATVVAVLFPEESANGVNGVIIMLLYLLDTFFNILCELLISKQSRYNFLVSVVVEILEIAICVVLMYRFATMATTLFFWLPIDIVSFINWSKHKDEEEEELTAVRRLKGYQEVLIIAGIFVWTVVVGYFLSGLDIQTDFIQSKSVETAIAYLDACASAVGVANGLFIFFRLREQWIAWYVCAALEAVINVISGQYVLLVLKLGYFTNTTYGYIKWSRYIRSHKESKGLF
ncbi:MAG: nicotinamide mononucleotide transporter [Erysipelotrichaceae bacterium]|nr:nicotinamide mononucleotide transporter [Erysipelotrichaceae bacterium]